MIPARSFAASDATAPLAPWSSNVASPVRATCRIRIQYCGVCHSDLHFAARRVGPVSYPPSPATRSSAASPPSAAEVTRHKVGDTVGVGCLVDSCRTCAVVQGGPRATTAPRGFDRHLQRHRQARPAADLRRLLRRASSSTRTSCCACRRTSTRPPPRRCCARASRPTRRCATGRWRKGTTRRRRRPRRPRSHGRQARRGDRRRGHACSPPRRARRPMRSALGRARRVVSHRRRTTMAPRAGRFDFILDTVVGAARRSNALIALLKRDGTLCLVGAPSTPHPSPAAFPLIFGRRRIAGSLIGGLPRDAGDARLLRRARHHLATSS